jgi:transposase
MQEFIIQKKVKSYCLENNINMIYNPPYTSEFNPIELIFNKLKTEFKKLDHKNIYNDINKCLNKIYKKDVINCINHSLKIINSYK